MFTSRYHAYAIDREVAIPGYVDREIRRTQYFVKEYFLFGLKIHTRILFAEHVPNWAWIQQGTCGFCEWRSAAPQSLWDLCTSKSQAPNRV